MIIFVGIWTTIYGEVCPPCQPLIYESLHEAIGTSEPAEIAEVIGTWKVCPRFVQRLNLGNRLCRCKVLEVLDFNQTTSYPSVHKSMIWTNRKSETPCLGDPVRLMLLHCFANFAPHQTISEL